MSVFRLRIEFEDRTGMVLDTSQVIAKYNLSILALEVLPNLMYLEIECADEDIKKQLIMDLAPIPDIKKVDEVQYSSLIDAENDPFQEILGECEV